MPTTATKPTRKPAKPKADDSRYRDAAERFKFLSEPTRLKTICALGEGERSVGDLCELLGTNQPALSHTLMIFRAARLVGTRREGKRRLYSLTEAGREIEKAARGMMN